MIFCLLITFLIYYIRQHFLFTGIYYIDPNQGDPKDAIQVYCDMEKKATCIIAKPEQVLHFES